MSDIVFCWCCGLPLEVGGSCSLCDYIGVACDPPHECMKRGPRVIGMCHEPADEPGPTIDRSQNPGIIRRDEDCAGA